MTFYGNEAIGITKARIVAGLDGLLFFGDEGPNLIGLHVLYKNIDDQSSHELFGLLTSLHQNLHDRVPVGVRNALRASNGVAFDQEFESEYDPGLRDVGAF